MAHALSLKNFLDVDMTTERPQTLAAQAADKLRELILLERLPPDLALNERDLSQLLGISRTPVRDAIRQLQSEGLVTYSATRRPRVANPSMETVSHWLMVQAALEGLAGERACAVASDRELQDIAELQRQMVALAESDDRLKLFGLDMAFHRAIVAAAHNPALVETHTQYNSRLWRARFISSQRRANQEIQRSKHQAIVDALLARNSAAASSALVKHLGNAVGNIKAARDEREAGGDHEG